MPNLIDLSKPMSPLADPVSSAIFSSVETAGLAAESLIDAILRDGGDKLKGKITSITPQRTYSSLGNRGCRVDMEMPTDTGDDYVVELQINPDAHIITRDLFSASHKYIRSSSSGDTSAQMANKMPRIIYINILGYTCRTDNNDVVQPFGVMYKKTPIIVASSKFSGFNIQLPKISEMKPDFDNPLYCWCYALYTAHKEVRTMEEVVNMTAELQIFKEQDSGFKQFCEQYSLVASDPQTQNEYVSWVIAQMRIEGGLDWARQEGETKGMIKGKLEGKIEVYYTDLGLSVSEIAHKLAIGEAQVLDVLKSAGLI